MSLAGKKIIVTGGSQGIGEAAVRAYVQAGAQVFSLDINEHLGSELAGQLSAAGPGTAKFLKCDVSNRSEVDLAFDTAAAAMGGLDVFAHIAGVHRHACTHDVPDELLSWIYAVNVYGAI
jgi:3-oxoacyl-[acyl-carrier protein] reductase